MTTIGERIKRYRKERGFTQKELAEKTNLSRSHIASIERNQYTPSIATLTEIANALSINSSILISPEEAKEKPIIELSPKDKIEIDEYLDKFENELLSQSGLMFNGEPMTQESREKLISAPKWLKKKRKRSIPLINTAIKRGLNIYVCIRISTENRKKI